jgi:hypothetical protein
MLKMITNIHQQLRNKELPRFKKFSSVRHIINGLSNPKTNAKKLYSVFVSSDDTEEPEDKVNSKYITNESSSAFDKENDYEKR